jgi:hypothetical protein
MDVNIHVAQDCMDALYRIAPGFVPKRLGCGSSGCVFPAGAGRVAKVSWDADEAAASVEIMKLGARKPAQLPAIHGVYRIPANHPCLAAMNANMDLSDTHGDDFYVTVREDLAHLKVLDRDLVNRIIFTLEEYGPKVPWWATPEYNRRVEDYETNKALFWPDAFPRPGEGTSHKTYKRDLIRALKYATAQLQPGDRDVVEHYIALRKWAARYGWIFGDVRIPNMGLRADGTVVLRDYGEVRKNGFRHAKTYFYNPWDKEPKPGAPIDGLRKRRRR